jgi:Dockerin type I domain
MTRRIRKTLIQRQRRRKCFVEQLESRNLLAALPFGQNPLQRLDVSRDGTVSALDALRVINAVGRSASSVADPAGFVGNFIDVNGDGGGTALDALQIINAIGRPSPLLAVTLPTDSGPANQPEFQYDLLTNNYDLDVRIAAGELGSERTLIRVGAESNFQDIPRGFEDGKV